MEIMIKEDYCFCCGKAKKDITIHHTLSQRYNPDSNVLVPLCTECHSLIHSEEPEHLLGKLHAAIKNAKKMLNKFDTKWFKK